jgi:predicted heme/steroid binding protein
MVQTMYITIPCSFRRTNYGPSRSLRHADDAVYRKAGSRRHRVVLAQQVNGPEGQQRATVTSGRDLLALRPQIDVEKIGNSSEENLRAFIKTRASLVPDQEVVFWFGGEIHAYIADAGARHILGFEGYNIARCVKVEGGWRILTREVGLYRDPDNRRILHGTWNNPFTGMENQVVHVWNDPVNLQFLEKNPRDGKPFLVPFTRVGADLCWHIEIFLRYPNPLPPSEFPAESASPFYESAELFQLYARVDDLHDSNLVSVPCQGSWVRMGQWLPWMEMGERPGRLVYHCFTKKLENGYQDLPEDVRAYVEEHHPEYMHAPSNYMTPNETSWTYFRKLLAQKGSPRADGTIAKRDAGAWERTASPLERVPSVRPFTTEELAMFDGSQSERPIYVAVNRRVFDVTQAAHHYRAGEPYHILAGRDASRALVFADLSAEMVDPTKPPLDIKMLTSEQRHSLEQWTQYFAKTYPEVGYLI